MADEQDLAGIRASGEVGGQRFAFGFVVGEADFDQTVIGERLVEGGEEGVGDAVVTDMDNRIEFLRPGFEFAESGFVHALNLKSE